MNRQRRDEIARIMEACFKSTTPLRTQRAALFDAALDLISAISWHDIATAPKDGTTVLLRDESRPGEFEAAKWCPMEVDGLGSFTIMGWSCGLDMPNPTHWMEIPQ